LRRFQSSHWVALPHLAASDEADEALDRVCRPAHGSRAQFVSVQR
jgi:hypothetical protein